MTDALEDNASVSLKVENENDLEPKILSTKGAEVSSDINQVKLFGKEHINVVLVGDTFDDAYKAAVEFCTSKSAAFVHPFDGLIGERSGFG